MSGAGRDAARPDGDPGRTSGAAEPAERPESPESFAVRRAGRDADRRRHRRDALIDQAVGIVMARSECPSAEAAAQLAEIAGRSGRDIAEVAADLVAATGRVPIDDQAHPDTLRLRPEVAALDRSRDGDELARALVEDALAWSGAVGAEVWGLDDDGAVLLIGAHGFAARELRRWRRIPPALDAPATRVIASGAPLWVDAASTDVPPLLGAAGGDPARRGVRVAAPVWSGRSLAAIIVATWPAGALLEGRQRREVEGTIQAMAPALLRILGPGLPPAARADDGAGSVPAQDLVDLWPAPALALAVPPGPGARHRIVAVNAAAAPLLEPDPAGLSLEAAAPWLPSAAVSDCLAVVERTGAPGRHPLPGRPFGRTELAAVRLDADTVLVTFTGPGPAIRTADDDRFEALARVGTWRWEVGTDRAHWSPEALRIVGAPALTEPTPIGRPPFTVHPEDADAERRFAKSLIAERSPADVEIRILHYGEEPTRVRLAALPVLGEGDQVTGVFGVVQDVTPLRRAETALEVALVQLAAQRSRADAERQVASVLQQVVVPASITEQPAQCGAEVAARYRPASAAAGVGGDWYSMLPLPDGRLLLSVGDVAGHGLPAASAMAALHHALRGISLVETRPGPLLTLLNALMGGMTDFTVASACCMLWDAGTRTLTWANAGHPRPLRVRADAAAPLEAPTGPMLGADPDAVYQDAEEQVLPGDVLLLYTDGLVERRRAPDDEGHLLRLAARPDPDLDAYVERILAGARSDTDDDVCVVAVRLP